MRDTLCAWCFEEMSCGVIVINGIKRYAEWCTNEECWQDVEGVTVIEFDEGYKKCWNCDHDIGAHGIGGCRWCFTNEMTLDECLEITDDNRHHKRCLCRKSFELE